MIKLLSRYIASTIFTATGMAALVIAGIVMLLALLGEMKNIGEGEYGLIQAVIYVFYRLPNEIYQFSPMVILLGSIMGLSILSSHKELSVMRASGFSTRQIILSVLGSALLLILAISIIGEAIAPNLSYRAELRKENAQNAGQAVVTASGVWFHVDNNFIHVEQVIGRQLLQGVTRYQFDNTHHLQATYYAKTLSLRDKQWVMNDVLKTMFFKDRTKSISMLEAPWDLKFNVNLLNLGLYEPREMTLPKLVKFTKYLEQNGLQAKEYQYQFWQRLLQPLASLIMIFLAIPFVLGVMSAATMGWRLVVGILMGFAFFICNALLGQLCIVYQVPPVMAALIPLVIFAMIGVILTNRLIRL